MVIPTARAVGSRYNVPGLLALDSAPNVLVLFFSSTSESFLHTVSGIVTGSSKFTLSRLNDPRGNFVPFTLLRLQNSPVGP